MLITPESNRHNQRVALTATTLTAVLAGILGWFYPPLWIGLALSPLVYWWLRRRCLRRLRVMKMPFPPTWETILQTRVAFFQALDDAGRERFRQMVKVFLDEVRITGIKTEVDDTIRVLVAASAIIPIFGFHDWDYHHLGEVLIYPSSFGEGYQMRGDVDENILGMVGLGNLSGVMILSKPSLLQGYDIRSDKENVGIHEFAHLVEKEEADISGLPPEVPRAVVKEWISYVARELAHPPQNKSHINTYAYTNEAEFFAVLAEYFFKSPEILKRNDPKLYEMLRAMFHQDPLALLRGAPRRRTFNENAPCPCGSGKKYKECCLVNSAAAQPKTAA